MYSGTDSLCEFDLPEPSAVSLEPVRPLTSPRSVQTVSGNPLQARKYCGKTARFSCAIIAVCVCLRRDRQEDVINVDFNPPPPLFSRLIKSVSPCLSCASDKRWRLKVFYNSGGWEGGDQVCCVSIPPALRGCCCFAAAALLLLLAWVRPASRDPRLDQSPPCSGPSYWRMCSHACLITQRNVCAVVQWRGGGDGEDRTGCLQSVRKPV